MRWRWDFLNPLVLNGFRGFWHCHVPSRANGLLRADVEPATDSQAPVGAMWRVWALASQIQDFPGSPGFQALQRVFDPIAPNPPCLPCKTLLAGRFGRSGGVLRRGWSGFFNPCHRAAGCPGVGSFGCLPEERLLDVFESAQVLDSYAQQVLRFRVLVL